jgi:hypothetical protein
MQPEFSPTPRSVEQTPDNTGYNYEIPPNYASFEQEQALQHESGIERSPVELAPQVPLQPMVQMPPVTMPTFQPQISDDSSAQSANPISANDDDVIEKEWVDRAKQVLAQTREDPYQREKAIGELQRDYLMKRYGKELGSTAD